MCTYSYVHAIIMLARLELHVELEARQRLGNSSLFTLEPLVGHLIAWFARKGLTDRQTHKTPAVTLDAILTMG